MRISACLLTSAIVLSGTMFGANRIGNPGFETGDFSSWTVVQTVPGFTINVDGLRAHNGSFGANFFSTGPLDSIFQDIATTPGVTYNVTFLVANNTTGLNEFIASFGGVTFLDLVNQAASGLKSYSFNLVATSALTRLQFSGFNGPGTTTLDDVFMDVAVLTPEPSTLLLILCVAGLFIPLRKSLLWRQN